MAMFAAIAASAGSNMISSLGTAGIQAGTAIQTNNTNLNFQNSVIDRGEKAFQQIGLPKAFYYAGNNITSPNTMIHLGGQNFYEQSGVNANLPYFNTSPYMQYNKAGTPKALGKTQASSSTIQQGQNDRMGLGNGRYGPYNAVPPGNIYNSAGTQTGNSTRSYSTQYQYFGINKATQFPAQTPRVMYPSTSAASNSRWEALN